MGRNAEGGVFVGISFYINVILRQILIVYSSF